MAAKPASSSICLQTRDRKPGCPERLRLTASSFSLLLRFDIVNPISGSLIIDSFFRIQSA
jgi:hypothetical protein